MLVIKTNGKKVYFEKGKVKESVVKAFASVYPDNAKRGVREELGAIIEDDIIKRYGILFGESNFKEPISSKLLAYRVALGLMRLGWHKVAKAYALYAGKVDWEVSAK